MFKTEKKLDESDSKENALIMEENEILSDKYIYPLILEPYYNHILSNYNPTIFLSIEDVKYIFNNSCIQNKEEIEINETPNLSLPSIFRFDVKVYKERGPKSLGKKRKTESLDKQVMPESSCKKSCNFDNNDFYNSENDYHYTNLIVIRYDTLLNSCQNMFNGINIIKEVDLTKFDFSNVNNMENMFRSCSNLIKVKFSNNIDTSSVSTMKGLFSSCTSLTTIDISKFKTQSLKVMEDMFASCSNLFSIDFSNFETSTVTNMRGIFFGCRNLRYLDLSSFSGNSVTYIPYVFSECISLIYLNLNNFVLIHKESNHVDIFRNIRSSTKVCISDTETLNTLKKDGMTFDCSDICFDKSVNFKIDLDQNKCCQECDFYEHNNYCYNTCPSGTYAIEGNKLCLDSKPIGYYLDSTKYIKCFDSCKDCNIRGNESNNNCLECNEGYKFLEDSNDNSNCYQICIILMRIIIIFV